MRVVSAPRSGAHTAKAKEPREEGLRGTKQQRSLRRRAQIAEGAIQVLADHGVAGVTHRLVAHAAGVSLAATTYYFDSKFDMVAEASSVILGGYVEAFSRAAGQVDPATSGPNAFRQFVFRLIHNAAERDRTRALGWAEITLDAHRRPESLALSQQWFEQLFEIWGQIASANGFPTADTVARSAIDVGIGLLMMTVSLNLNAEQIDAVLAGGADPLEAWLLNETERPVPQSKVGRKAAETRDRILTAAIEVLVSDGPAEITYRRIAALAGLTPAGPFYHYPTIAGLLTAAQARLFEASKVRYRAALAAHLARESDMEDLIDRSAAVLLREATEYANQNLATYAIWLQAARQSELRPMVRTAILDQHVAWTRTLKRVKSTVGPADALMVQALFLGKLIRLISTGSTGEQLASVRREFAQDLTALASDRLWVI